MSPEVSLEVFVGDDEVVGGEARDLRSIASPRAPVQVSRSKLFGQNVFVLQKTCFTFV